MRYPFYEMTPEMLQRLEALGAKAFVVAKNFDFPHHNRPSSVHFFKSAEKKDGGLEEVAYFSPTMHDPRRGALTGFNEIERINKVDIENIQEMTPEDTAH